MERQDQQPAALYTDHHSEAFINDQPDSLATGSTAQYPDSVSLQFASETLPRRPRITKNSAWVTSSGNLVLPPSIQLVSLPSSFLWLRYPGFGSHDNHGTISTDVALATRRIICLLIHMNLTMPGIRNTLPLISCAFHFCHGTHRSISSYRNLD
jgi:hypothetical protein